MNIEQAIKDYAAGPQLLRDSLEGLNEDELRIRCSPGKWSILEVVCHLADFELVYADRIKRVLVDEEPTLLGGDPDEFAARLAYHDRVLDEELAVIDSIRAQITRILSAMEPEDFERLGKHSVDGPLSLAQLLQRITAHIPHHVRFIADKKANLVQQAGE